MELKALDLFPNDRISNLEVLSVKLETPITEVYCLLEIDRVSSPTRNGSKYMATFRFLRYVAGTFEIPEGNSRFVTDKINKRDYEVRINTEGLLEVSLT